MWIINKKVKRKGCRKKEQQQATTAAEAKNKRKNIQWQQKRNECLNVGRKTQKYAFDFEKKCLLLFVFIDSFHLAKAGKSKYTQKRRRPV